MALIRCVECNKEISDTARICPNCGYRIPPSDKEKQMSKVVSIGFLMFFLCAIGICCSPLLITQRQEVSSYQTYDNNGLVGYNVDGSEIRGHTSQTHFNLGDVKKDYSKANLLAGVSIFLLISTGVYVVVKIKEINKKDIK